MNVYIPRLVEFRESGVGQSGRRRTCIVNVYTLRLVEFRESVYIMIVIDDGFITIWVCPVLPSGNLDT